jgi:DNA-binding transcriptional LysR family regulator
MHYAQASMHVAYHGPVELRDVEAFLAVARVLHFARAAETLSLSQPALSRRIQRLERELGAQLFTRDRRAVTLTDVGRAMVGPATKIIEAVDRATEAVSAARKGEIGRVAVAFAGTSSQAMVAELARQVRRHQPGLAIELLSSKFALPALDLVVRGKVDVALGRWTHIPIGVATRVVAVESLVLAAPPGHWVAGRAEVRMADLRDEPWVTLPSHLGSVLIDRLHRLAARAGFVPRVVQEAPDTWTVLSLVEAGVGCTLTLSSVFDNLPGARVAHLAIADVTDHVEVRMAWLETFENRALAPFLRLTEQVLPSPEG